MYDLLVSAVVAFLPISTALPRLLRQIKDVLNPNISLEELLTERAEANERLLRALHISNTFVSANPSVHKAFVARAQNLIKAAQRRGWPHFQTIAVNAVQWQLISLQNDQRSDPSRPQAEQKSVTFDSFIQNVTLIVVLVGILQVDKPIVSFSHDDVSLVANRITILWALSKNPNPIPPILLEELNIHLRRLVPLDDEAQFPLENPLDFVIPAWETLWRVVATTVAYAYGDEEMRRTFERFNASLSDDSFRRGEEEEEGASNSEVEVNVSVKGIVSEAMRLHPPTKHIGRMKRRWIWFPPLLETWIGRRMTRVKKNADIERVLQCDIWGPDANEFEPARHHIRHILPEQTEALGFVFGHGPLRCIAASWAPMAVGVIAGVVLEQLDIGGCVLDNGPAIGGREGWAEWLMRKAE